MPIYKYFRISYYKYMKAAGQIKKKGKNEMTITTIEIQAAADAILANYPADDHAYISYEESADLIEANAESMAEVKDAQALRKLAELWFAA